MEHVNGPCLERPQVSARRFFSAASFHHQGEVASLMENTLVGLEQRCSPVPQGNTASRLTWPLTPGRWESESEPEV